MLPVLRPLALRSVALLWGGIALSAMGDQLFIIVLGWIAVERFGTYAGLLPAAQSAMLLAVSLLSGRLADRQGLRATLIGADLARAAMLGLMVTLWLALGTPPGWSLMLVVITLAAGQSFFQPAMQGLLPLLAPRETLPATNALMDMTDRLARLIGPGVLSLAAAVIPLVHFVTFDLLTFLASATAVSLIRLAPQPRRRPTAATMRESLLHGFRAVRRHKLMWFALRTTGIINGAWYAAYFIGLPLLITQAGLSNGVTAFGLVISAYGATNLLANLLVGSLDVRRHPTLLVYVSNIIVGLGILLLAGCALLLPQDWLLAGLVPSAMLSAFGGPMKDITLATLRQTELPQADIPPAMRAFVSLGQLGTLTGLLASPLLFALAGVPGTVLLCGAAILGVGLAGFWLGPR